VRERRLSIHAAHGGDRAIAVPATLGGPLADFAYHVMIWRIAPDVFRGLAGLEVADLGIPSEKEYVAEYCRATDRDGIRDWDFYIIFSMFRIAAILQGIARPAIDGTAADANAASVGRLARLIADQAWSIAGRLAR
jgi:aminoglycoside phosphotransferase (APT) family kinase protein